MTREIYRVTNLKRTSMSPRDLSHQTPTWTRSVGGDFLWWRKMLYCTVTSTTRTKRCHRSAGGALPPMVRSRPRLKTCCCNRESRELKALRMWRRYDLELFLRRLQLFDVCVCVWGQLCNIDVPCASLLQAGSGPSQCRWNTTGWETTKTWPSWRERAGEVSGRQWEREKEREAEKGGRQRGTEGAEVSGWISHNILTLSDLRAKK